LRREKFRPFLSLEEADEFVAAVIQAAELEQDPPEVPPVTRDPKDDYLVALAISTGVDALVSGDDDLVQLAAPPVNVRTPRSLLDAIES
jgi:putative PIN family toxin of toxin-antitoxin system